MFEASTEIPYEKMEKGASIIPLGELFSVKRSGKYNFRQYALGNLLKKKERILVKPFRALFLETVYDGSALWRAPVGKLFTVGMQQLDPSRHSKG
jgi:hypothetical protein